MKDYSEMTKEEKKIVRQSICDRAYKEIPNDGADRVINLGFGVAMGIVNSIQADNRTDILLQGESCIIGMGEFLKEGNSEINMHHIDPEGTPVKIVKNGATNKTLIDAFAFINSKKIFASFLGAFQVSANGDLANWCIDDEHKSGAGGAFALCNGVQHVIICMIEHDRDGNSKLMKECTIPLTGEKCVDLVITDCGVYKPNGNEFLILEKYNFETGKYE